MDREGSRQDSDPSVREFRELSTAADGGRGMGVARRRAGGGAWMC